MDRGSSGRALDGYRAAASLNSKVRVSRALQQSCASMQLRERICLASGMTDASHRSEGDDVEKAAV